MNLAFGQVADNPCGAVPFTFAYGIGNLSEMCIQRFTYIYSCGIARAVVCNCNGELDDVRYVYISAYINLFCNCPVNKADCSKVFDACVVVCIVCFVFESINYNVVCNVSIIDHLSIDCHGCVGSICQFAYVPGISIPFTDTGNVAD